MVAGIICEYNPFHAGHGWMLQQLRAQGMEAIVCAMSGNFTQRGQAACFDKYTRTAAALRCGADLVIELPVCHALSGDELAVWLACQDLTKLTREDYADFCDESCRLLTLTVQKTGSRRCLDIFEYLEKQRSMLIQNPSLTALAGALAAFCGKTV